MAERDCPTLIWRDSTGIDHDLGDNFETDSLRDDELIYLHALLDLVKTQLSHIGVHRLRAIRQEQL